MSLSTHEHSVNDYLSMDGIPSTITIKERIHGNARVQFTIGHCVDDSAILTSKNFAWDDLNQTYVRIWANNASLSSLLHTFAIEPGIMRTQNHCICLLNTRCFLPHFVFSQITSATSAHGFKWSKQNMAWAKKMKLKQYKNEIQSLLRMVPPIVIRNSTQEIKHRKEQVKDIRLKQNIEELKQERQQEHFDRVFNQKRDYLMYCLHRTETDESYQIASYKYGKLIKMMAENGCYDYPDPPNVLKYRLP